jgi:hypothetical protein
MSFNVTASAFNPGAYEFVPGNFGAPAAEPAAAAAAGGVNVVLLPDARFFVKAVPVNAAAGAEAVSREVELALEVVSPFPVSQLFYGHLWHPESAHALVFAAFRRRFTDDEQAAWAEAERVVPHFVLGASLNPGAGRTVVLGDGPSLTAVYWGEPGPVPSRVVTAPLSPDASDAERTAVRSALLRAVGSVGAGVVDLPLPVRTPDEGNEQRVLWAAGEYTLSLPLADGSDLDVRDKGELAARRASQRRARLLWRGFLASLGALVLLALGEAFPWGGVTAEIVAKVTEEGFHLLDAPPQRLNARDTPVPYHPKLWAAHRPTPESICDALRKLLSF